MSGTAAYAASVQKSGTSTGFTDEATTNTSGDTWRIDDTTKRVWDRDVSLTFYDNAVAIDAADISDIDYLFGEVTFTGTKTGPITVDGSYLPMAEVARAKEVNLSVTSGIEDSTDFSNAGYHTKEYVMQDVALTLTRFDDMTKTFTDLLANRSVVVIDVNPGGNKHYKGFYVPETVGQSLDINTLIEESLSFQIDGDTVDGATFSIKTVS